MRTLHRLISAFSSLRRMTRSCLCVCVYVCVWTKVWAFVATRQPVWMHMWMRSPASNKKTVSVSLHSCARVSVLYRLRCCCDACDESPEKGKSRKREREKLRNYVSHESYYFVDFFLFFWVWQKKYTVCDGLLSSWPKIRCAAMPMHSRRKS